MIEYYEQLTQEEQEELQEILQKLYRQTFILERKYDKKTGRMASNKEYYFCEKHMDFLTWYLSVAGIRICENIQLGTIYIQGEAALGERLPRLATIYLLLLKLIYDEQMTAASSSLNVVTTLGAVNAKAGEFRLLRGIASLTEMKRALAVLRKYQLIELTESREELSDQTRIIIYPCINVVLMREDILALLGSFEQEEADKKGIAPEEDNEPDGEEK